jgi:hypothetical protein
MHNQHMTEMNLIEFCQFLKEHHPEHSTEADKRIYQS